jgi:SAM-dependent methyltransferase
MSAKQICPNCGAAGMESFFKVDGVPVHSVQLLKTRQEALDYPKGDIDMASCRSCGFVSNIAFDPKLHDYSHEYESTQQYSPTFNAFHSQLARSLVERYDLHGKELVEIGCGQGEFLALLCEAGDNKGIGFDPAFVAGRNPAVDGVNLKIVKDYYSEKYTGTQGDFYCCKMTLEHISDTRKFIETVRRAIGDQPDAIVFFQVPDVRLILRELEFWDIYYEHCSYFSPPSLARLFHACGFDVLDLKTEYGDQYLMIEARPAKGTAAPLPAEAQDLEGIAADIAYFSANWRAKVDGWRQKLSDMKAKGQRAVIWGGGSKGVAFLTTLGIGDEVAYAVDINPLKHGTFMAGTGQEVVSPETLRDYKPDAIIVMNPIYCGEIGEQLESLGVKAELLTA